MADRLRATRQQVYGGVALQPGDEFVADSKFTTLLVLSGFATLVERKVEAPPAPIAKPSKPKRSKRRYRTRHLTPES